ncbi:agmatinase [Candidatus Dependentiae bacterium]|nr:agmatinase [Candidatus Dependentiae bacterium]
MLITENNLFISQRTYSAETKIGILGLPYDCTSSFRPGSRFAPNAIRTVSNSIETYSPALKKDLEDIYYTDFGDVPIIFGDAEKNLEIIKKYHKEIIDKNIKVVGIGGEHLVTYPLVKNLIKKNPQKKITVLQFDAHLDLRDDYLGNKMSHATVMNLLLNEPSVEKIIQIGIRSGTREEFEKQNREPKIQELFSPETLKNYLDEFCLNSSIYLTIDIDVLDPSIIPGTGTPEAGGLTYKEMLEYLKIIDKYKICGADLVELSPQYDLSGNSNVAAAKLLREILLIAGN